MNPRLTPRSRLGLHAENIRACDGRKASVSTRAGQTNEGSTSADVLDLDEAESREPKKPVVDRVSGRLELCGHSREIDLKRRLYILGREQNSQP